MHLVDLSETISLGNVDLGGLVGMREVTMGLVI